MEVYFDDFKVTHGKSPIVQSQEFYPFGGEFNKFSRENSHNKTIMQMIRVVVSKLIFLMSFAAFSQIPDSERYEAAGFVFKLERKALKALTDGCTENRVTSSVTHNSSACFSEIFCVADKEDIRFNSKGYITVVEHYSSPVGWTIFYVFDLCKKRVVVTRRIEEGESLAWEEFIDLKEVTKKKYVDKIVPL